MGVKVRDTNPETRIATLIVIANSRKSRPRIPPIKRTGIKPSQDPSHKKDRDKDSDQRYGHRDNRKANLARTLQRSLHHAFARFDPAHDVFQHYNRVINDEAYAQRKGHQ